MVYDNRNLKPPGSRLEETKKHGQILYLFQVAADGGHAICQFDSYPPSPFTLGVGVVDIMRYGPPDDYLVFNENLIARHKKNSGQNIARARSEQGHEFPPAPVVILIGGGNVPGADLEILYSREGPPIITVSRAQRLISGDYYVGTESLPAHKENLKDCKFGSTVAHLDLACYPAIADLGWERVTWYGVRFGGELDIPRYNDATGVSFTALQFAAKTLQAKKIILLGMEHPIQVANGTMDFAYFNAGIWLAAACWWLHKNGIEVWNCSVPTTVTTGVMLASLQDAFRAIGIQ